MPTFSFVHTRLMVSPIGLFGALFVFLAGCGSNALYAEPGLSWAQFHGPDAAGYSAEGDLPDQGWDANDYAWSVPLKSFQVGSPVIANGSVYFMDVTSADDTTTGASTMDLVAIDLASGKQRWRRQHPLADRRRHQRNTAASTTPFIAGQQIVFAYGDAHGVYLHCYLSDGSPVWSRELGSWTGYHGYGMSPMVFGSTVILFNSQQIERLEADQVPGESRMMAFDLQTGKDLWQTKLSTTRPCYGLPILYQPAKGSPQLIAANTGDGMFGLNPDSGELLWSLKVFDKRCCSSPIVVGDIAIGSCGSGGGGNILSGVKIPSDSQSQPAEVFRITRSAPYVPTPAVVDQLVFTISDSGIASCLDVSSEGQVLWSVRLGGKFGASPIVVGDDLLLISLDGQAHLGKAQAERPRFTSFSLGAPVGATPACSENHLVLRVGDHLHALTLRDK